MTPAPECVYYDTGDLLVTARRAAYKSVSVRLAGVTSARVEQQADWGFTERSWCAPPAAAFAATTCFLAAVAFVAYFLHTVARNAPPKLPFLLIAAVLSLLVLATTVAARWQFTPVPVPTWAVLLTDRGREVVLFHTRNQRKADRVAEAINRAVAAAERPPSG